MGFLWPSDPDSDWNTFDSPGSWAFGLGLELYHVLSLVFPLPPADLGLLSLFNHMSLRTRIRAQESLIPETQLGLSHTWPYI